MSSTPTPSPTAGLINLINNNFSNSTILLVTIGVISFATLRFLLSSRKPSRASASSTTAPSASMSDPSAMEQKPITESQLALAKGEESNALYIAIKDPYSDKVNVFDVSSGRDFYGPGSGYHVFAGRNATYGLSTSCLDLQKQDGDISTLTEMQKDTHVQWYTKYTSKYPIAGFLVPDDYVADSATSATDQSKKDA